MRSKIHFKPNLPVTVAFESPGTLSDLKGHEGEFQYLCTKSRIMWVSQEVHEQILKLGVNLGEEILIVPQNGEWQVKLAGAGGEIVVRKLRSEPQIGTRHEPNRTEAPKADISTHSSYTIPSSRRQEMYTLLMDALCASVDATVATQSYAASRGLQLKLTDGQVQDLASTALINFTRENENRMRYPGRVPYVQPKPVGMAGAR